MRVIGITGVSGYVGSLLRGALASEANTRVVGIDLVPPSRETPNLKFEQMDVRHPDLGDFFRGEGVDTLVHLACVFDPVHNRNTMRDVHVEGTRNLLAAAGTCGAGQILMLSGTAAYGAHPGNPPGLREDAPFRPNRGCSLAADQAEMERLLLAHGAAHPALRVAIARSCTILGPGADHFVARALREPLILLPAGADPEIQLIHEEDLADACCLILRERRGGVWNLVGEGTLRVSQCMARLGTPVRRLPGTLLEALSRSAWRLRFPLAGAPPGLVAFLRYSCLASGERAASELGFTPRHGAGEALESFLKTFL